MAVYTSLSQNRILDDILNRKGMGARQASDAQLIGGINRGGSPRVIPASSSVIREAPGFLSQAGKELSQAAVDLESAKKIGREYAARKAVAQAAQPTIVGEPTGDGGAMAVAPSAQSLFTTGAEYGDTKAGQFAFRLGERLMNQENLETARGIAAQNRMTDRTDRLERERLDRELRNRQFEATKVVPITSQADLNRIGRSDVKYDPNRSYYTQGGILKSSKLTDLKSEERQKQDLATSLLRGGGGPNKGKNKAWEETAKKVSEANVKTVSEWESFEPDNEIRLTDIRAQIDSGRLVTGPGESIKNRFTELALAFGNISGVNQDVVENFIGRANVTNYEEANKFTKNIFNLVNKQLRQENGVQAKDDFDRFFKELPNINDPQETVKVMTDYLVNVEKLKKFRANYVADAKAKHRAEGGSPYAPDHQDAIVQNWRKKLPQMSLLGFMENPEDPGQYERVYLMDFIERNVPEQFANNPMQWPQFDTLLKTWNKDYVRARRR